MPTVKFLVPVNGRRVDHQKVKAGDVLDVSEETAAFLLDHDLAELVKDKPEPKVKAVKATGSKPI